MPQPLPGAYRRQPQAEDAAKVDRILREVGEPEELRARSEPRQLGTSVACEEFRPSGEA